MLKSKEESSKSATQSTSVIAMNEKDHKNNDPAFNVSLTNAKHQEVLRNKTPNNSDLHIHSNEHDQKLVQTQRRSSNTTTFPSLLYQMIHKVAEERPYLIHWIQNGEAFVVDEKVSVPVTCLYFSLS